jgi:tetratricopeptide (TPR) repeat protein
MLLLLSKTLRKWSLLTARYPAVLSVAGNLTWKRSRLVLPLALVILAVIGAGAYGYACYQWQAAQSAVKEGQWEQAQSKLNFCLLVWPRSIPVHLLAARTARMQGAFKEAEAHLNRCLKLNHGASEAIQLEFLLLRVQGGDADRVFPELLVYVDNNSPESALILNTLAWAFMQNLRYGPAFVCLSRWHEVAPDSPEPFRWRGWVLERMSDREGAIKEYKQALEVDPDHVPSRLRLAEMYLERSDPLAALPHLEQLQKRFPDRPDIQARLGQCRYLLGDTEEARRLLEAAVEQLPKDSVVLIYLGKIHMQATPPRAVEAETWLRRALELDPTDTEAERLLALCLRSQGRAKEAQAMQEQCERDEIVLKRVNHTLRQEADKPVTDPAALTEVGVLFLRANNESLGSYWLNRALERDPEYQPALQALVGYYERNGQPTKADMYRRKLNPANKAAAKVSVSKSD